MQRESNTELLAGVYCLVGAGGGWGEWNRAHLTLQPPSRYLSWDSGRSEARLTRQGDSTALSPPAQARQAVLPLFCFVWPKLSGEGRGEGGEGGTESFHLMGPAQFPYWGTWGRELWGGKALSPLPFSSSSQAANSGQQLDATSSLCLPLPTLTAPELGGWGAGKRGNSSASSVQLPPWRLLEHPACWPGGPVQIDSIPLTQQANVLGQASTLVHGILCKAPWVTVGLWRSVCLVVSAVFSKLYRAPIRWSQIIDMLWKLGIFLQK